MRAPKSQKWSKAVLVEIEFEEEFAVLQIDNTREAAECLMELWPTLDGVAFHRALVVCATSLEGGADDRGAREAFRAAAEEADILVPIH
ncbi:hypothetical protein J2Y48_004526 [Mycoplana sp. BE70]|uniref:DUF982 domain-containing protein n=1 Tax=Mycoplana sp. BE70 TaxID=2817775 RepID=UPI0028584F0C|nr:DUF982 domain-containing protein [Mycoplana sp. BE70]MDR6759210.1 hypothetical protein [Mycoplana sp. BE70]